MDRRTFLLSSLALAGCRMGMNEVETFRRHFVGTAPSYTGQGSNGLFSDLGEGLKFGNVKQFRLRDYEIHHMQGSCVDFKGDSAWQDGGIVDGCHLHDSYRGIYTHDAGEGLLVANTLISNCVFGIHVDSGNNNFTNGQSVFCSIGAKISGGTNNSHGLFSNWTFRHNTYNLVCVDVTLGESFSNCNFIGGQNGNDQGIIQIINSKGIALNGGQISFVDITVDSTSQLALRGVTFRGPVNVTMSGSGFTSADPIIMSGATLTLNGSTWNGIA